MNRRRRVDLTRRLRNSSLMADRREGAWRTSLAVRNDVMREAAAEGWTNPEIAEVTGETVANVKAICSGVRPRDLPRSTRRG